MSVVLMGAVKQRGPTEGPLRHTLLVLCDEADDFGFACPSTESIASGSCCSVRQVIRRIQLLEQQGWLKVKRKVFGAVKGEPANVYFVDTEKLGIERSRQVRRSPLWTKVQRLLHALESRDKVSLRNGVLKFEKTPESIDIPASGDLFEDDSASDTMSLANEPENSLKQAEMGVSAAIQAKTIKISTFEAVEEGFAGDMVSRDMCHPRHVTSDTDGKPFNVLTRSLPVPEKASTPLPPSGARGVVLSDLVLGGVKSKTQNLPDEVVGPARAEIRAIADAVRKVMRECNLSEPRLAHAIDRAMRVQAEKTDEAADWNAIAERMIEAQRLYSKLGRDGLLRVTVRVRRFFAEGMWVDDGLWMIDEDRRRARASASVGVHRESP